MGYSVDLQDYDLRCKSQGAAVQAMEVVKAHKRMCPYHLEVSAWSTSVPQRDDAFVLDISHFQGNQWDDDEAKKLWVALCPFLADGATLELRGEEGVRWRIRWQDGKAYEEYAQDTIWGQERELKA